MAKRKAREEHDMDDYDISKPLDITNLGNEDDCFGRLHDLKAPECMKCGDSELCAIAYTQTRSLERGKLEKKERFKDKEEVELPSKVKKRIKRLIKKGKSSKAIVTKIHKHNPEILEETIKVYIDAKKP